VAQLAAGSQNDADYRILKGLNLRDEIGRYWRIAQGKWSILPAKGAQGPKPHATAQRFVRGLLRDGFGFDSVTPVEPVVYRRTCLPYWLCGTE